jgi:hypothetical protein
LMITTSIRRSVPRRMEEAGKGSKVECCLLPVLSNPGPAVPERDGWTGSGTPVKGYIYITPLQGSAVNVVISFTKRGREGWGF